jgi:hypothetical protein
MVPILRAMADNRWLEGIRITTQNTNRVLIREVIHILRTTVSLKSFELPLFFCGQSDTLDILNAIVANQTLTHVSLRMWASALHRMKAVLPFQTLHSVRELALDCSASYGDTLFEFLDTNHQLCHLSVRCFVWNQLITTRLVEGCRLLPSLASLSLKGQSFDNDSMHLLTLMLQTKTCVRQLCVELEYNSGPDPFLGVATVPTSLQKLTLLNVTSHAFDEWTARGSELRVPALRIHQSRTSSSTTLDVQRLIQFIQDLRYVRELEVTLCERDAWALSETVMPVLKRNFSLHHISLTWTTKCRCERRNIWDQDEAKLVRAFCHRNERLPLLLFGPLQPATMALFPMLLTVARQSASSGAALAFFEALLSLDSRNDGGVLRMR